MGDAITSNVQGTRVEGNKGDEEVDDDLYGDVAQVRFVGKEEDI